MARLGLCCLRWAHAKQTTDAPIGSAVSKAIVMPPGSVPLGPLNITQASRAPNTTSRTSTHIATRHRMMRRVDSSVRGEACIYLDAA